MSLTHLLDGFIGIALSSFECEPPDNSHEKERFKALK